MTKKLTRHFLLIAILGVMSVSFLFDWGGLKNLGLFNLLGYVHEGLSVLVIWLVYLYLKSLHLFNNKNVQYNLKLIVINLISVYVLVFALKLIFQPQFVTIGFPPQTNDLKTIIYSNLVSLIGLFSMVGFILALRNLIFYKPKKNTRIYFYSSLFFLILTAILTSVLKAPLDLSFSGNGIYNNGTFVLTLIFLFLLSLRNSWITYLSRKEKLYYTFIAILILWGVSYIFDYAYELPVAYHSLAQAVFINGSWFFLFFYTLTSLIYLMLQLPTARIFERKMQEVSSLQNLTRAISVEMDTNKLTNLITNMIINVTGSHVSWIELLNPHENRLQVLATKNLLLQDVSKLKNGALKQLSTQILNDKKTLVLNELTTAQKNEYFQGFRSKINSLVITPIIGAQNQFLGLLYAGKSSVLGFDPDDVNLLEAFANQVAIALENADLLQKSFERERLEKELQIAREVQMRLLPQTLPQLKAYQLTTETITAYEVGGDYFDFIPRTDANQLGIVIGDVSGKGTSAAFYMAEVKGIIQSIARQNHSPAEILGYTNKVLATSLEKKSFITLTFAILDSQRHQLKFARAGHCPLVHFKAKNGQIIYHQPAGIAVGLDRGQIFKDSLQEHLIDIDLGDVLVFYTDGLSEAMNGKLDEYTEVRLADILKQFADQPVEIIKKRLIEDVFKFVGDHHLHDDLTLILLKRIE
ncbi:MAG: SpoIIE family protein phosphatase [Caldisericaceae bacterium]|nr:SpoIIE family protein phosphatase [Caldisericaceae bacterium]